MLERLRRLNLAGPLLIAPGTAEKLNEFLKLNPRMPKERLFVDDSSNYQTYKAMGFGRLDFNKPIEDVQGLTAPSLDPATWFTYLSNVMKLSPIRDPAEGVPEGVLLLGGTFVVKGTEVVYARADRLPGDYPKPETVFAELEGKR